MTMVSAPDRTEAAEYYYKYIDLVPARDIREVLQAQLADTLAFLTGISDQQSRQRYAPDKWSIRQVVSHINDTERLFTFRALWFGRALPEPLPSFEQDIAIAHAAADDRSWSSHIDEFRDVRSATLALFQHLPPEAWGRNGIASGKSVTVRALAYITAGHVAHHVNILRDKYLAG